MCNCLNRIFVAEADGSRDASSTALAVATGFAAVLHVELRWVQASNGLQQKEIVNKIITTEQLRGTYLRLMALMQLGDLR